jgi:hypothetical protein
MAELETLIPDIHKLLNRLNNDEDINAELAPHLPSFMAGVGEAVEHWATPQIREKGSLRMSNIGKPDRQLWFDKNSEVEHEAEGDPVVQMRFLLGHILEQVALLMIKSSGHTVTNEQGYAEVSGIKGSMDSVIDGEVVDIKTASPYAFKKKFKYGGLPDNDEYGYLAQLAAYEESYGTDQGGFFAIEKASGEMALYRPEYLDKPNTKFRIKHLKDILELDTPPELCYPDQPEGTAGNMIMNSSCKFCKHKEECRADTNDGSGLRKFQYSNGVKYFTKIIKEPRVEEIL